MNREPLLDFTDDPAVQPAKILSLLRRFLPFAVEAFTERRDLFDMEGYEPGLRESNFAVVLAEAASSPDYADEPFPRAALFPLVRQALERAAAADWEKVPPLAWNYIAYAALLSRGEIGQALFDDLSDKAARWADRMLAYDFPTGLYRDTKAEETCWTVGPLVGAQAMRPDDPRRDSWQEKAHCFFLNSYNREEDLEEERVVEGKPVRARVVTANLFPDFTQENHGAFHPTYQTCINNYAIPYILYKKFLGRVPESLTWNWKGIHSVMARLYPRNGRIFFVAGNDYHPSCHCHQAHYLAIVTDALKDPLGLWAIKKALANVELFQRANGGRVVNEVLAGKHHIYWEFHFASFLAFAHALAPFRGVPVWGDAEAVECAGGPWVSPYTGVLVHKGPKLHSGFSARTLMEKRPGCGFVVPQDAPSWTDHFCGQPQLAPEIRDAEGRETALALVDRVQGTSQSEAWMLGAWADREYRIRRTSAFLAHEEGALHVERIMRYGEQVPIFGSDMTMSRARAEGPGFGPWNVRTLNYRVANEAPDFRPIRVQCPDGEWTVLDGAISWSAGGDWVLLDGRLGLIRLWGGGAWLFDYRLETEPLHPGHFWTHNTWALNVSFLGADPPPRGHGLMGGHAVLFVPASDPRQLADLAARGQAKIGEHRGDFSFQAAFGGWHAAHLLRLGHLLGFA